MMYVWNNLDGKNKNIGSYFMKIMRESFVKFLLMLSSSFLMQHEH